MRASRSQGGFSLIELMLVVSVMAIVASQLMLVFGTLRKSALDQERVSETQQDVRLLMDVILADLRMAGFMVPRETAVGSIDGGTGGADVICASDPNAFVASSFASATDRFEAASTTTAVTGPASSITLATTSMDIDSDGTGDFSVGGGILISDGVRVHCARVQSVSGGIVTFSPATPSGTTMSASTTRAVPAFVYQLSGSTLTRNGMVLSDQVEDLQVEFGVDANADGEIGAGEFPIHDLNGSDTSKVRLARLHLTTRTSAGDPDFDGKRAAAANRAGASSSDNFRRRKAVADAHLRNTR